MKLTAEMMKKIAGCGRSTGDLEEMLDDARREEKLMARRKSRHQKLHEEKKMG